MNAWNFYRLINTIYRGSPPDLELIERLGLLAVKIGQVYALRPDFLSEEQCRELSKLYRHTEYIPKEDAKKLFELYAGENLKRELVHFDEVPVASASIGQVHRGKLKTGEDVAIKLVKKQFTENFKRDVDRVKRLFRVAIAVYPKLAGVANPVDLLAQIEKMTLSELDLRNEVSGHDELLSIYERYRVQFDLSKLRFAKIYKDFSGQNILVSEFLDTTTIDELLEKKKFSYDKMLNFFQIQGFYTFFVGVFHGDIHPGNIMVSDDSFYFVDTGYIGRVSDKLRINLFRFFDALSVYDYDACAAYLNKMAEVEIEGDAYKKYREEFFKLYADFKGKSVSQISFTKQMMQTIRQGVLAGMKFGEGIFDIIKSMMYLDGMVLRCNPDAVLLEDMRPFLTKYRDVVELKK